MGAASRRDLDDLDAELAAAADLLLQLLGVGLGARDLHAAVDDDVERPAGQLAEAEQRVDPADGQLGEHVVDLHLLREPRRARRVLRPGRPCRRARTSPALASQNAVAAPSAPEPMTTASAELLCSWLLLLWAHVRDDVDLHAHSGDLAKPASDGRPDRSGLGHPRE